VICVATASFRGGRLPGAVCRRGLAATVAVSPCTRNHVQEQVSRTCAAQAGWQQHSNAKRKAESGGKRKSGGGPCMVIAVESDEQMRYE
jgi:hypothetical protein